MALKKTIVNNKGVVTSYHKITALTVFKQRESRGVEGVQYVMRVQVGSYTSADMRQKSETLKADIMPYTFICSYDELTHIPTFTLAYSKLKELERFAEAEDC